MMVCGPWYVKKPKKPINASYVKKAELSTKSQIGAAFLRGDFFPAGGQPRPSPVLFSKATSSPQAAASPFPRTCRRGAGQHHELQCRPLKNR
jgi:hypothetical protein